MLFNSQILFAWCCCEIRIKEIWNASCSQKQPFSSSFLSNNISPAAEVKYTIWKSWKYLKLKIKFSTNRILFHLLKVKKRKSGITTVRLKLSLILKLFANQEQTKNKKKKSQFCTCQFPNSNQISTLADLKLNISSVQIPERSRESAERFHRPTAENTKQLRGRNNTTTEPQTLIHDQNTASNNTQIKHRSTVHNWV